MCGAEIESSGDSEAFACIDTGGNARTLESWQVGGAALKGEGRGSFAGDVHDCDLADCDRAEVEGGGLAG